MRDLVNNQVLVAALLGWIIAQTLKLPIYYLKYKRWNWALWFAAGGMPSSHSSLISATTLACGLYEGFGSPVFALAFAVAMVILYDAAGVRRQAGLHAQRINHLIEEIFSGHPITQDRLKEVLGHTPREVLVGMLLGIVIAIFLKFIWP